MVCIMWNNNIRIELKRDILHKSWYINWIKMRVGLKIQNRNKLKKQRFSNFSRLRDQSNILVTNSSLNLSTNSLLIRGTTRLKNTKLR